MTGVNRIIDVHREEAAAVASLTAGGDDDA
jgi:hypothetical protein